MENLEPIAQLKAKSVWDTEEEDDEYLGADMDANDYFMKIDPAGTLLQKAIETNSSKVEEDDGGFDDEGGDQLMEEEEEESYSGSERKFTV